MMLTRVLAVAVTGAVLAASATSCHHKKDDETEEYLTGTLAFDLPSFMESGTSLELIPSGVTDNDGNIPGIYWTTSQDVSQKDTTRREGDPVSVKGTYILDVPSDFYGDITITCYAYADGYYLRTQSAKTTVINRENSLKITGLEDTDPMFTDARDGRQYRYITLGGLDWMAANLAYSGGFPAYGTEFTRSIFGSFFTWDGAVSACPDGWRLPGNTEWKSLSDALGGTSSSELAPFKGIAGALMADAYFNDDRMWAFNTTVRLTATSGFNALPLGYANVDSGACDFHDSGLYGVFWTADELNERLAYYRYLYVSDTDMNIATGDKSAFSANVRCVRDAI